MGGAHAHQLECDIAVNSAIVRTFGAGVQRARADAARSTTRLPASRGGRRWELAEHGPASCEQRDRR